MISDTNHKITDSKISVYIPIGYPQEVDILKVFFELNDRTMTFNIFYDIICNPSDKKLELLHNFKIYPITFEDFIFKVPGIKMLFTVTDFFVHITKPHILLAKKIGLPTIGFQHGVYPIDSDSIPEFTRPICDWTFYWADLYSQVYTKKFGLDPTKVFAVGNPRRILLKKIEDGKHLKNPIYDLMVILCNHEGLSSDKKITHEEMSEFIRKFCCVIHTKEKIQKCLLRIHPAEGTVYPGIYKENLELNGFLVDIDRNTPLEQSISNCGKCIVIGSSSFLDALVLNKPTLLIVHFKHASSYKNFPRNDSFQVLVYDKDVGFDNSKKEIMSFFNGNFNIDDYKKIIDKFWGSDENPAQRIHDLIISIAEIEYSETFSKSDLQSLLYRYYSKIPNELELDNFQFINKNFLEYSLKNQTIAYLLETNDKIIKSYLDCLDENAMLKEKNKVTIQFYNNLKSVKLHNKLHKLANFIGLYK